jgi:hypothetical protein
MALEVLGTKSAAISTDDRKRNCDGPSEGYRVTQRGDTRVLCPGIDPMADKSVNHKEYEYDRHDDDEEEELLQIEGDGEDKRKQEAEFGESIAASRSAAAAH